MEKWLLSGGGKKSPSRTHYYQKLMCPSMVVHVERTQAPNKRLPVVNLR